MNQPRKNYGGNNHHQQRVPDIDLIGIKFDAITPELFDTKAKNAARIIAGDGDKRYQPNKPTQLRRFYDEIVMWDNKLAQIQGTNHEDRQEKLTIKFNEYLPFIRMLNAKVAYAKGRKLVDDNFTKLLSHCLGQVNTPEQMQTFKLFMEAFMGFYKVERPRD